jgi:hypothetical protein
MSAINWDAPLVSLPYKNKNNSPKAALEYCVEIDDIQLHWSILQNYKDAGNHSGALFKTGYLYGYLEALKHQYRNTSIADEIFGLMRLLDKVDHL